MVSICGMEIEGEEKKASKPEPDVGWMAQQVQNLFEFKSFVLSKGLLLQVNAWPLLRKARRFI